MSLAHLFNISVDVKRPTITQGTYGEQVKTWATIISGVMGRLQRKGAREIIFSDKETVWSDYTFYCDDSVALAATDQISYDGRTFEVRGFDNVNQEDLFQKVDLLEIK